MVRLKPARLALGYGIICTAVALAAPIGKYQGFLLLIGSVFAPLFGVLLADHFIVRRRRLDVAGLTAQDGVYWFTHGLHLPGLLAWGVGIAAYQALGRLAPNLGATLPSFVVAAVIYVGLRLGRRAPSEPIGRQAAAHSDSTG